MGFLINTDALFRKKEELIYTGENNAGRGSDGLSFKRNPLIILLL